MEPNAAHYALARLEGQVPEYTLATQNVDGLHHRAGSRKLVEIHGSILRVRRFNGCVTYTFGDEDAAAQAVFVGDVAAAGDERVARDVPRCPVCGDYLRPDVVWFGENLPEEALETAFHAAETADLCLVIGTSSVVYPAAMLPDVALQAGAAVVEINPEETPFSTRATLSIRGAAGEVVPAIVR